MTDDVGPAADWPAELVQLGGSIRQDGDPATSPADEADEQAGIERYLVLRPGSDAGLVVCHRARVSSAG